MAGETQDTDWPQPKFNFTVTVAGVGTSLKFQEVSGLDVEAKPIELRGGTRGDFSATKLPGLRKFTNITLRRGVFVKDNALFAWLESVKRGTTSRSTVTITLSDESGRPTITWTLANAWPAKIAAPNLNAEGNEVVVDTLELAHEGLTIEKE